MDKSGIYCFVDKQTNKVVYVGQAQALYNRLGMHYASASTSRAQDIDKALYEDFERYEWRILELCDKSALNLRECYWIKYYNTLNEGYNKKSIGQIEQIDIYTNEVIAYYNTYTEAANAVGGCRTNICNCANGRANTAYGYKWRYNGAKSNTVTSVPGRGKARAVVAYDASGTIIKTYPSSAAAARDLHVDSSAIGHVLKGRIKTCKGYVFKYADEVGISTWET